MQSDYVGLFLPSIKSRASVYPVEVSCINSGQESLLTTNDGWFWLCTHLQTLSCCLLPLSMSHCDPSLPLEQPRYWQLLCLQMLALRHFRNVLCPQQLHKMIFWISFLSQSQHLLHIPKWPIETDSLQCIRAASSAPLLSLHTACIYMCITRASKQTVYFPTHDTGDSSRFVSKFPP